METSTRAVSHLKLAVSNIHRSTWALGGALLANADLAVQAAPGFLDHLDTTPSARAQQVRAGVLQREGHLLGVGQLCNATWTN